MQEKHNDNFNMKWVISVMVYFPLIIEVKGSMTSQLKYEMKYFYVCNNKLR